MPGKPVRYYTHIYDSPVGPLYIAVNKIGALTGLAYAPIRLAPGLEVEENKYACGEVELELDQYFAGERKRFTFDLDLEGTAFFKSVWSRLTKISYGTTASYGEIAKKIGRENAARAVGNAVAANPAVIVVPCHRVLPATGDLGSYAVRSLDSKRGRDIKAYLLELEREAGDTD